MAVPTTPSADLIEVRRSARRRRSVSAYRRDGKIIIAIPSAFSAAQEREWVDKMAARLMTREARRRPSDAALAERAGALNSLYLDGAADVGSVAWSTRQLERWGSATPSDRSIRLSTRLRGLPEWVLDYVLVHELAHLIVPDGHTPQFWDLVGRYPRTERARGFLQGIDHANRVG